MLKKGTNSQFPQGLGFKVGYLPLSEKQSTQALQFSFGGARRNTALSQNVVQEGRIRQGVLVAITRKLEQQSRFNGARAFESCPRSFRVEGCTCTAWSGNAVYIIVRFQRSLQHSGGRPPVWALMNLPRLFKRHPLIGRSPRFSILKSGI
jgi:hypothetical protein